MTDEEWIEERLKMDGVVAVADDMRAAIARGREQGRAEGSESAHGWTDNLDAKLTRVRNALTRFGVPDTAGEVPLHRAIQEDERVVILGERERALAADRDRLAKRVQELEADIAGADEFLRSTAWENPAGATTVEARVRLAYEAGVTDGAHNEAMVVRSLESRLAATDARLTALVEALAACFGPDGADSYGDMAARLTALRAPGVGAIPTKDALREAVVDLMHAILGCDGHPCRVESDPLAYLGDAVQRCRDVETSASQRHEMAASLATARRERDEAVGVLAEVSARMTDDESLCWCASARLPGEDHQRACTRARALVAGQGAPTAERKPLRTAARERQPLGGADAQALEGALSMTERERDEARASLAEAQGEVARSAKEAQQWREAFERAHGDVADLTADRDTLRTRLVEAGRLIERAAQMLTDDVLPEPPRNLVADLRAWGKPS